VNIEIDLLYMMNNITAFLGVNWYLGLPFAYPINITGISEMTGIFEEVLGDSLIALQLGVYCSMTKSTLTGCTDHLPRTGNEPDLYVSLMARTTMSRANLPFSYGLGFRKRPFNYWIPQYIQEWNEVRAFLSAILLSIAHSCSIASAQTGHAVPLEQFTNHTTADFARAEYLL
jgi:hypothetical protein